MNACVRLVWETTRYVVELRFLFLLEGQIGFPQHGVCGIPFGNEHPPQLLLLL